MARKPTDYVQFKLRIRESLRRKIEREAEKKKISANAEAVERLQATFDPQQRDTKILDMMVENQDDGAILLRTLARELGSNPHWAASAESRKAFADRMHTIILYNLSFLKEGAK